MDQPPIPQTPRRRMMTRDQRVEVHSLRRAGFTFDQIALSMRISVPSVAYAAGHRPTPQHHLRGPDPAISEAMKDLLVDFVTYSQERRQMSYHQVAQELSWGVSSRTIRKALRTRGFRRCRATIKPKISEANRIKRLQFALDHLAWTRQDWNKILWSDETWVTDGKHRPTWYTRMPHEVLDPAVVAGSEPKRPGWMFWGSFSGEHGLGPSLVWEKEWGTINANSYGDRILPLVHGWMRMHPELQFMQDNAPAHSSYQTFMDCWDRGFNPISWPAYSPDLNPIESLWNAMKDWIDENYPNHNTLGQLHGIVREAWDAIGRDTLDALIDSMPARMEAVIAANGMNTVY